LPPALLPSNWPGTMFRQRFEAFDELFVKVWRRWLRAE
jgi:DNA-binding transcriptional regulator PaaX